MSATFDCGLPRHERCATLPTSTTTHSSSVTRSRRSLIVPTTTSDGHASRSSDILFFTLSLQTSDSVVSLAFTSISSFGADAKFGVSGSVTFASPTSTVAPPTLLAASSSSSLSSVRSDFEAAGTASTSTATQALPAASVSSAMAVASPESGNAHTQPQSWTIALIILAVAALLASFGACIYVYFSRWRKAKRVSLSQDVMERYMDEDAMNPSLVMLPGTPRSPSSPYTATSAFGSWTNLPFLTPTLTPGFDAQSQQASIHDAARQSYVMPTPEDQSLRESRSTSSALVTPSGESRGATSASKPTTAKTARTFVTDATAGSRPSPVLPLSDVPLPLLPLSRGSARAHSPSGHVRANTQRSSKTFATAATVGSIGTAATPSALTVPATRADTTSRPLPTPSVPRPLPTPSISGHARGDTQTSSQTFATEATQGSHPWPPSRRMSVPSGLVSHDPFSSTRPAPLAVSAFPHWPPSPPVSWTGRTPPQSPPPPPPPPVPPIPQHHRGTARVPVKSTRATASASTTRSSPSHHTTVVCP